MARTKKLTKDEGIKTPSEAPTKTEAVSKSSPKTSPSSGAAAVLTMEELLKSTGYTLKGVKKGDVIEGNVTGVSSREITIDIGGKTEGVVIDRELTSFKDALMNLKPGDKVVAQVIVSENDRGQAVLSLRKSIFEKQWLLLEEAHKNNTTVEAVIKEQVRGGALADVGGLRGYIPQSQLDQMSVKTHDRMTSRKVPVKVMEVDRNTNRLILSQRAVMEEQALSRQKDILTEVTEGQVVQAVITGVVPFGAFAKFAITKKGEEKSIEGLIHISEIAWEKVEDPNLYLKTGDSLKVKIIGIDLNSGKLTLSLKQLLPDPWEHVIDMFEKDQQIKGTVTRVTPYGIFVALSPGIEGLIHISKIAPGTEPKSGEEITCIVEDVQPEKRKISLSMALTEKPIGYR